MPMKRETLDAAFAQIEQAAVRGERCPQNHELPQYNCPVELARERRILIEISSRNWRVVTLLTGPHAGKKTAPDPAGRKPWKTLKPGHVPQRVGRHFQ